MTTSRPAIKNYLLDMDGVLVHEERMIPGGRRVRCRVCSRPGNDSSW